jgi:hypothetical protein
MRCGERSRFRPGAATIGAVALMLVGSAPALAAEWQDLPDWSGVWRMVGPTVFDRATVQPKKGRTGSAGVREFPPYNQEWEQKYEHNIELVKQKKFPDPLTNCGLPAGFPRILNVPDVYEFVVRPEQTWILTENGPNVMRIYTDGRDHPPPEDRWPTFTGDSVGHWEGDTLVFSTVSVKGDQTIIDRTGLIHSDQLHAVTRLRKVDDDTLQADMVLEDDLAFTKPWHVTKQYERLPSGTRVFDYACAENNRNPVTESGQTLTLGPNGTPLDNFGKPAAGESKSK